MLSVYDAGYSMDVLDKVVISPQVYKRWAMVARAAVSHYPHLDPDDIPLEKARVEPDGRLVIYVEMPDGSEVSMHLHPSEWRWVS